MSNLEKEPGAADAAGSGTDGNDDQGATGDDTAKSGDDAGDSDKQPA